MLRLLNSLCLAMMLCLGGAAFAECSSGEVVIRFSHVNRPVDHPIGAAASTLEARVNSEMDGLACMEVYANSTLYTDDLVIDALLNGDIQMAAPSFGKVEAYTRQLRVFSMPFAFKNLAAVEDFQSSLTGELLKNSMIGKGVRGLGFWHNGMNQMTGARLLQTPDDLKGWPVGFSGSDVGAAMIRAMGATPIPMAFAEKFAALKNGAVQATEDTWTNIYGKKFHTVQAAVTETNHSVGGSIVVTANGWWKSLPSGVSTPLLKIFQDVTSEQNQRVFQQSQAAKANIAADGGVIHSMADDERAAWVARLAPVWDNFSNDVPPELLGYITEVNKRN